MSLNTITHNSVFVNGVGGGGGAMFTKVVSPYDHDTSKAAWIKLCHHGQILL